MNVAESQKAARAARDGDQQEGEGGAVNSSLSGGSVETSTTYDAGSLPLRAMGGGRAVMHSSDVSHEFESVQHERVAGSGAQQQQQQQPQHNEWMNSNMNSALRMSSNVSPLPHLLSHLFLSCGCRFSFLLFFPSQCFARVIAFSSALLVLACTNRSRSCSAISYIFLFILYNIIYINFVMFRPPLPHHASRPPSGRCTVSR